MSAFVPGQGVLRAPGKSVARSAAVLRRTRDGLMRCLEGISQEELHWRPDEGIPAISNHLLHLVGEEERLLGPSLGRSPRPRDRSWEFTDSTRRELDYYVGELGRVRSVTETWLAEADDSESGGMRAGSLLEGAPVHELLDHLTRHEVHHRAQVVFLLKLVNPARTFPTLP